MDRSIVDSPPLGRAAHRHFDARRWAAAGVTLRLGFLFLGCALAVVTALHVGHPSAMLEADADLARLMRSMAALKGLIVLAAVAVVAWRFGRPATPAITAAYLVSLWVLAAATVLIWRLCAIPLAAVSFHIALIALLVAAWRDDNPISLRLRGMHVPKHQDSV